MLNKRRGYIHLAAGLLLLLALTACGSKEGTTTVGGAAQNSFPPNGSMPHTSSPVDNGNQGGLSGSGVYQGQADTTSIEITVNGKAQVFQLGEVSTDVLDGIKTGETVKFDYTEQDVDGDATLKQYTLTKLEKADVSPTSGAVASFSDLPKTKDLDVTLEGDKEQRTAQLAKGDGYALYVPDGFTFDAANNKLMLTVDNTYFSTITQLPADYKLEFLKFEADQELSEVGRVKELSKDEIAKPMQDAELFMLGDGSVRDKEYIVKSFGGQGYVFRLDIPVGEPSEGFTPLVYAALNSLVTLK